MGSGGDTSNAGECNEPPVIAIIRQLEESYTCYICLEVMACPYSTRQCGHSFCATCILKWFFRRSSLFSGFDAADCPICRCTLIDSSKNMSPFIRNKTIEDAIRTLVDTISKEADSGDAPASTSLAEWRKGGWARQEWDRRNQRDGNQQMSRLTEVWPNMDSDDYINIKTKLGLVQESDLVA